MKKIILVGVILFSIIGFSNGQNDSKSMDTVNFKHSLGIGAGFTTGLGMSYRFAINKFKIQTTFAPIKDDYSTDIHLGITAIFRLIESEYTNFYLYQGNYFHYDKLNNDNYSYSSRDEVEKTWNHGIGVGIEFVIVKRIGLNLMAGYAGYDSFDRIGLTGETGLYYIF